MHVPSLIAGLLTTLSGVKTLKGAFQREDPEDPSAPPPRRRLGAIQAPSAATVEPGSQPKVTIRNVENLEERVEYIAGMIHKGKLDPKVRKVATAILTKKCKDERGEETWCVPEKDWVAEIEAVFNAVRQKVRYTMDVYGVDTYQHPKWALMWKAGDCFPKGTLLLTRDGFVPVEEVEIGDEIHDGETWVEVLQTWDRGPKEIIRAGLNNGSALRLSQSHKVLRVPPSKVTTERRVPGPYESAEEVTLGEARVGDELLQPRRFDGAATEELDEDDAFMIGAYLAEGCRKADSRAWAMSLAGVANRKGIRERALNILLKRGIPFKERERELRFSSEAFPKLMHCGRIAIEKHLPTFRYGPRTIAAIVKAMETGDGGWNAAGTSMTYSTISPQLALQYRVLRRFLKTSVSWTIVTDHGGFGPNPIHRLIVRNDDKRKPWAKILSLTAEDEPSECFDIMTTSGRVYLPESDVIVRQCDDYVILTAALLQSVGYAVRMRVIQTKDAPDFNHIYLMVQLPKGAPHAGRWVALDASVDRPAGWEAPKSIIKRVRDFEVAA